MSMERGSLLYQQKRYDLAEAEFRHVLGDEPQNALAHAMLGLCLCEVEKFNDATAEARQAIHLRPDWNFGYYTLSLVLLKRHRLKEASQAIQECIRLDPFNPGHFELLGQIRLELRDWPGALEAANQGLASEPDHVGCLNVRTTALVRLGRRDDASNTIQGALSADPRNPVSHANQGWALLHAGKPRESMEHFREALRLEPDSEWAKAGLVEAMKARNFIYRWMLHYFLWMSRFQRKMQWGIIIGAYLGVQGLRAVADAYPAWSPWIWPIVIAYVIFAYLTWFAGPLFNLLLRLDRFGRYALSRDQTLASNWTAISLLAAIVFGITALKTGNMAWVMAAVVSALLVMPITRIFSCEIGWPRRGMVDYSLILAAIGIWLVIVNFQVQHIVAQGLALGSDQPDLAVLSRLQHQMNSLSSVSSRLTNTFVVGMIGTSFVANWLTTVRVKR